MRYLDAIYCIYLPLIFFPLHFLFFVLLFDVFVGLSVNCFLIFLSGGYGLFHNCCVAY